MTNRRMDVWWRCVCVLSTVGVLCAYTEWGWNAVVMAACTVATIGGSIGASVWAENGRATAVLVTRTIVAGGWFTTSTIGLVAVLGVAGLVPVVLLAVLRPGLGSAVRRARAAHADGSDHDLAGRDDLRSLDDEALCRVWRRTFAATDPAGGPTADLTLVDLRARILDELHRRSPSGLTAWWVAGGPASGSPLPYLGGGRDGRSRPGTGG